LRGPRIGHAVVMGFGLAILANSRPFEGLVASVPAMLLVAGWLLGKSRPTLRIAMTRVMLPLLLVLSVIGCAMAYYNARITGNPFRMPYQVHDDQYVMAPIFLWQGLRPEPV